MRLLRSIRLQGLALLAVLVALPLLVAQVLGDADAERRALVLEAVSQTGAAIGVGLGDALRPLTPADAGRLDAALARYAAPGRTLRVLFRPAGQSGDAFFLLAAAPPIPAEEVAEERRMLVDLGVLPGAAQGCAVARREPVLLGVELELLTAVVAVPGQAGCWAVVIGSSEALLRNLADGGPYWQRPEARAALAIYALMAALVGLIFAGVWLGLRRMQLLAASARSTPGFARSVDVPELAGLAGAFDAMVLRLRRSADMLRQAAEDNAHAFKGPIGTIRQALEPLRGGNDAAALGPVDGALARLDGLVQSARVLDAAAAELLVPEFEEIDLSALTVALLASYATTHRGRVAGDIAPGLMVRGQAEALETVLENLVDNAISFAPPIAAVQVSLRAEQGQVVLLVADDGPGVDPARLGHLFERYYSHRPEAHAGGHFGIGLWLVRQHVVLLGGSVTAANRTPHGLVVEVRLPGV